MAAAKLIKGKGLIRVYRSTKNVDVTFEMHNEWTEIIFKTLDGKKVGNFSFSELEDGSYRIMRMFSGPNIQGGIGTAALKMFKELTGGALLYASTYDGMTRDDQSHLTDMAKTFVDKMIKMNLIDGYLD